MYIWMHTLFVNLSAHFGPILATYRPAQILVLESFNLPFEELNTQKINIKTV